MSHDESIESVASERLTAPGVVDRAPVLNHYDRLQHPLPGSALVDRLYQRAAYAEQAEGSALVWRRSPIALGSLESETTMAPTARATAIATATAIAPAFSASSSVPRSAASAPMVAQAAAPGLAQRLIQRQHAPGVVAASDSITRVAEAESPTVVKNTRSPQMLARQVAEKSAPAAVMRHVAPAVTRHVAHSPQRPILSMVKGPSIPAQRLMTQPTSMPVSIARKHQATAAAAETPRIVSRSAESPSTVAPDRSAPVIALAPSSPASATPLVLRRVAAPVPASPSTPPVAYSMPSSSAVAEELTRAAQAERTTSSTPHAAAAAHAGNSDIDQLAEQVERRLRQRLEIERERRGIRSWR
jgi:hypothetical protein